MKDLKSYRKSVMDIYRQSFARGTGSVMAIPGNYFSIPVFSSAADAKALQSDWSAVGQDIRRALEKSRI